jgi:hypothetical protein
VITNKHVVAGAQALTLTLSLMPLGENNLRDDLSGVEFTNQEFTIADLSRSVIEHPSPDIDLCAIIVGPLINEIRQYRNLRHAFLNESWFPDAATRSVLRPVEPVIMVGYPNGLWDEVNNMPIVRAGLTGSHPLIDWNGKKQFIIDAACFPGSSGSPVFLFEDGMYRNGDGYSPGTRICLLGILWGGPLYTIEGRIEQRTIPTGSTDIPVMNSMMNLGFVIRYDALTAIQELMTERLRPS